MDLRSLTSEELVVRPTIKVVDQMCPLSESLTQDHDDAILIETMTYD